MTAIIFLVLLTVFQIHFAASKPTGFSLRLIPSDSPESPLYPGNLTQLERIERLINFSNAKAYYLEPNSAINTIDFAPNNINLPMFRDNFFYMVQVGIGSNRVPLYLLMDTASGLTWTQCQPCINCYAMRSPMFDSRSSVSYKALPCDHPLCNCQQGVCVYNIGYSGGATTSGVMAFESFAFQTAPLTATVIDNIVFGCAKDNRNIQFAKNGVISGILGLDKSAQSLLNQQVFGSIIQGRFSYCLVPFTQALQAPSVLRFGEDIPPRHALQTTNFVFVPGQHFYFLNLLDISVASQRIGFSSETFQVRGDGSGGCIIDSGALIPRIDEATVGGNAFRMVMRAFQRYYDSRQLQRIGGRVPQGFTLCYRTPTGFQDFASLTYHFEGADYTVEGMFAHFIETEQGYFCVALVAGNKRTVLGAWHQQNMRVVYNLATAGLQFEEENCADDTT